MNKQHKCLKFTSEAENDNSFSFLDIKINCHNQQFQTSVYRKPTFSSVFTYYESYVDQAYKKSLTDTLLFCCFFNFLFRNVSLSKQIFVLCAVIAMLLNTAKLSAILM